MITIFKLHHRGKYQIGIKSPLPSTYKIQIKTIEQLKFSRTHGCWYIPYTKLSFHKLKSTGIPFIIEKPSGTISGHAEKDELTGIAAQPRKIRSQASTALTTESNVQNKCNAIANKQLDGDYEFQWNGNQFWVKLPFNQEDVDLLKSLKGSYWHDKFKQWVVRSSVYNLKKLQAHFSVWEKVEYEKIYELIALKEDPQMVTFYCTPQYPDKVIVKVEGFQTDVSEIKRISGRVYEKEFKRWIIDRNSNNIKRLTNYYTESGTKIINRIPNHVSWHKKMLPSNAQRLNFLLKKVSDAQKGIIEAFALQLLGQNYSWNTISSYCGKLMKFMDHYPEKPLKDRSAEDARRYLAYLAKADASMSLINQAYSAIKLYYEQSEYRENFQLEKLERPRKHKYLPTILSIGEVDRMFRTVKNLKHLAIMYSIYGGGLRLAEVIGIRVRDVHWDRNQLLVMQGKGKKDRMVPLSLTLKSLLEKYFDEYKPRYWLFEGQDLKTQYSRTSIQKIVKKAAKTAGITRKVTPHTLRHCFATHLLDHGTDVRYIQELLGHKDIKTTLIYTHVTTRSISQIQSPLDTLKNVRV